MSMLFDRTLSMLQLGLTARTKSQAVTSGNIANADTPGYRARRLNFRDALQRARGRHDDPMTTTRPGHTGRPGGDGSEADIGEVSIDRSPGRADGNNVDLEREMSDLSTNALEYQALTTMTRKKFGLMRYIASQS